MAKLVMARDPAAAKSDRSEIWNSYSRMPVPADVPFFTTSVGRYEPAAAPSGGESAVGGVIGAPLTDVVAGLSGALLLQAATAAARPAAPMNTRNAFTNDAPEWAWGVHAIIREPRNNSRKNRQFANYYAIIH